MGLTKYIILSLIYILTIGGFVFYKTQALYLLDIGGYKQSFYIAFLFVAPIMLFLGLSIIHILIYGLRDYIKERNSKKDLDKFLEQLQSLVLGKKSKAVFFNKDLQEISSLLNYMTFPYNIDKKYSTSIEDIDLAFETVQTVHNGIYVDKLAKTFKLEKTNPLYLKNIFNKFNHNNKFYIDVLKNPTKYNKDIVEFAFLMAIEHENFNIIENEISHIDISKEAVVKLFKIYQNEQNPLNEDDYLTITQRANLSADQYIQIVKVSKVHINPEIFLSLMDKLSNKDEKAIKSYLYLLLDLEMIDEAKELLTNVDTKDDEYAKFKIYLSAKDSGAKCSISDFI